MVFSDLKSIQSATLKQRKRGFNKKNSYPLFKGMHRSNMMLNPLNLKHLNRLDTLECDAVTLNLEDAIAPARKEEALVNIAYFLSHLRSTKSEIIIRVNPLDQGGREEIAFLKDFCFNAIRLSKVKSEQEVVEVLNILDEQKGVHISLETKEAFSTLGSWQPHRRFERANIGILDLLADLKLPQSLLTPNNPTISYILSKFLIDAKSIDIAPVSFMYQEYKNIEAFQKLCLWEKSLGFSSKACLGPAQVSIANKIFMPSKEEIERAKAIVKSFEASAKGNIHGFLDERYGLIDEPIYKDAKNLLNLLKI